jgi:transposase
LWQPGYLGQYAAGNTGHYGGSSLGCCREEVSTLSHAARRRALDATGLTHPRPEGITAPLFVGPEPFFFPLDKVQVKYEMLRAHVVDGATVVAAAHAHGYSRAAFYLALAAFEDRGMAGLLDDPRGRRGPVKLTPEIVAYLRDAHPSVSGAQLAVEVVERFDVSLHRRTIERARRR